MATGLNQYLQWLRVRVFDPPSRSIRAFWSWWRGELLATLPPQLREAIGNASKRIVVTVDDAELVVTEVSQSAQKTVTRIPLDGSSVPDSLPTPFSNVVLALPAEKVLQRTLTLPLAAEENMLEVLGFEMDRQTPFARDQVYYDFHVTDRQTTSSSITVNVVVSPKKIVDEYLEALGHIGLVPDSITTHDEVSDLVPVNLLPRSMRRPRRYSVPGLNTALAGVAVVLLVVALALPPILNKQEVARLEQELVVAEAAAQGGLELRREVERITETSEFLTQKKNTRVLALQILEEVSRVLPDNTWLTRFDINGAEIQLQGQSTAAAELIQLLESSPLFRDARFRSPVVQVPRTDQERFHLSVQLQTAEAT